MKKLIIISILTNIALAPLAVIGGLVFVAMDKWMYIPAQAVIYNILEYDEPGRQ